MNFYNIFKNMIIILINKGDLIEKCENFEN